MNARLLLVASLRLGRRRTDLLRCPQLPRLTAQFLHAEPIHHGNRQLLERDRRLSLADEELPGEAEGRQSQSLRVGDEAQLREAEADHRPIVHRPARSVA